MIIISKEKVVCWHGKCFKLASVKALARKGNAIAISFVAACCSLWQPFPNFSKNNVTSFAPQARRLMFGRRSAPDYPFSIFSVSFVFLNSILFCVISTVLWGGATSIFDGIIKQKIITSGHHCPLSRCQNLTQLRYYRLFFLRRLDLCLSWF